MRAFKRLAALMLLAVVALGIAPVITSATSTATALLGTDGVAFPIGSIDDGEALFRSGSSIVGGAVMGGSTGSTDNAVLRANGTGGATAQGSSVVISDAGRLALYAGSSVHALYPPTTGSWSTAVAFTVVTLTDGDGSYDVYCYLDLTRTAGGAAGQQGGQVRVRALRSAGVLSIRHSAMSSYLGGYAPSYTITASGDAVQVTATSAGSSGEYMSACTVAYAATDLES